MKKNDKPVLVISFNRPNTTEELLIALKKVNVKDLYIFIDGPREENIQNDLKSINKIKKTIEKVVDWDCNLKINSSAVNLGCGLGPIEAITWFFENVDEGIILEDDCIPSASFFDYVSELLDKYRDKEEVFLISGDNGNILPKKYFKDRSYLFSQIPLIWGWASWSDRWSKFDNDLSYWNKGYKKNSSKLSNFKFFERLALFTIFRSAARIKVKNFWDYQFFSTMIKEKSLCIIPRNNLIQNIGWGESATHTKKENYRSFVKAEEVNTIIHPQKILSDIKLDNYISYKIHHGISKYVLESNFLFLYRLSFLFRRGIYKLNTIYQYVKSKILN